MSVRYHQDQVEAAKDRLDKLKLEHNSPAFPTPDGHGCTKWGMRRMHFYAAHALPWALARVDAEARHDPPAEFPDFDRAAQIAMRIGLAMGAAEEQIGDVLTEELLDAEGNLAHAQHAASEPPTVQGTATWGGDAWQIEVTCPYCDKKHYHGGGGNPQQCVGDGHRVAHCVKPKRDSSAGYTIQVVS